MPLLAAATGTGVQQDGEAAWITASGSVGSNFNKHNQDFAIKMKAQRARFAGRGGLGGGEGGNKPAGGGGGGRKSESTDDVMLRRFARKEARRGGRR